MSKKPKINFDAEYHNLKKAGKSCDLNNKIIMISKIYYWPCTINDKFVFDLLANVAFARQIYFYNNIDHDAKHQWEHVKKHENFTLYLILDIYNNEYKLRWSHHTGFFLENRELQKVGCVEFLKQLKATPIK